jgi:hypothetical protein
MHLSHAQYGAIGYLNQVLVAYRVRSGNSIIIRENDRVRHSFWEALSDIPQNTVSVDSLAGGISEFARSVFFRSIKTKDLSLLRKWWPVVMKGSPVGRLKMSVLIFSAVIRVGLQESLSALCRRFGLNHLKILYRR